MREDDETVNPEFEYKISDRIVNVGRIYPFFLTEGL
jgi:hypothetical protein